MANSTHSEPDPEENMSNDIKAFRTKVVGFLMRPAPAGLDLDLDETASLLDEYVKNACRDLWDSGHKVTDVNADMLHLESWKYLMTMAEDPNLTKEYLDLVLSVSYHDPPSDEYAAYHSARVERKKTKTTFSAAFETRPRTMDGLRDLMILVQQRTKSGATTNADVARLILKIWLDGASSNQQEAAREWCEENGYRDVYETLMKR